MKIVILGGGHGTSQMLKALSESHEATAIISGADNGGSTRKFVGAGMFPPGDITRAVLAVAPPSLLTQTLLNARFGKGDSARNTILWERWKDAQENIQVAVEDFCEIVGARKNCVIPITMTPYTIAVHAEGDFVMRGERLIDSGHCQSRKIYEAWLENVGEVNPVAIKAIKEADVIILSSGDVYTSVVPCLLVPGVREVILESNALVIYCANLRTKWGETHSLSVENFLDIMLKYAGKVDGMLANCSPLADDHEQCLKNAERPSVAVLAPPGWDTVGNTPTYGAELLWTDGEKILHDPAATRTALEHMIYMLQTGEKRLAA